MFKKRITLGTSLLLVLCILVTFVLSVGVSPTHVVEAVSTNVTRIRTAQELAAMTSQGHYVLANDINLTQEWVPIEDFRGTFDGQGHSINNLRIQSYVVHQSDGLVERFTHVGFFGTTYGATVKNITINISGDGVFGHNNWILAGGLIGAARNTYIINAHVVGDVRAYGRGTDTATAGGLVGSLVAGHVEHSSAIGYVHARGSTHFPGNATAGGLVGAAGWEAVISNSFSAGRVYAHVTRFRNNDRPQIPQAGGLVGGGGIASIINSYSTSDVYARNNKIVGSISRAVVGGLYAGPSSVSVSSFRLSTQDVGGTGAHSNFVLLTNNGGIPLTVAQMRTQSSFEGWDFNNVWEFRSGENNGFPVLRRQILTGLPQLPDTPDLLPPGETYQPYEQIARFIMAHGERAYTYWSHFCHLTGATRGGPFLAYRVNGRVLAIDEGYFTHMWGSNHTYYLISAGGGTPRLVTDNDTLARFGFLHDTNLRSEQYVRNLNNRINQMRTLERHYQEDLRTHRLVDAYTTLTETMVGGIAALVTRSPRSFLFNFARSQVLDAGAPQGSQTVRTQQFLRSSSRNALNAFNSNMGLLGSFLEGRPVLYHNVAVSMEEALWHTTIYDEFMTMDIKYLRRATGGRFMSGVRNVLGSALSFINNDFVEEFITINSDVSTILGGLPVVSVQRGAQTDPDLDRMFSNIDFAHRQFMQRMYHSSHANIWGNLELVNSPAFGRNTPPRVLNQTVIIHSPMDVAVYNQAGARIGKVENGVATTIQNPLVLIAEDNYRVLIFPFESRYRIELAATQYDIMTYMEFRVDGAGNIVSETIIYGVTVKPGDTLSVNPPRGNAVDYSRIFVNNAPINIVVDATATRGGVVYGNRAGHVKGDAVQVFAVPNERYSFVGWFENNQRLPHANEMYEFTAVRDRTLEARFVADSAQHVRPPAQSPTPPPPTPRPTQPPTPPPTPRPTQPPVQQPIAQMPSTVSVNNVWLPNAARNHFRFCAETARVYLPDGSAGLRANPPVFTAQVMGDLNIPGPATLYDVLSALGARYYVIGDGLWIFTAPLEMVVTTPRPTTPTPTPTPRPTPTPAPVAGRTATVSNVSQFHTAMRDPDVSTIVLTNDIDRTALGSGSLSLRAVGNTTITGNFRIIGYTMWVQENDRLVLDGPTFSSRIIIRDNATFILRSGTIASGGSFTGVSVADNGTFIMENGVIEGGRQGVGISAVIYNGIIPFTGLVDLRGGLITRNGAGLCLETLNASDGGVLIIGDVRIYGNDISIRDPRDLLATILAP